MQKLKLLADENPLISYACLYIEQDDALISSDQTVKPLEETGEADLISWYRSQTNAEKIFLYEGSLYIFYEIPGGRSKVLGVVEVNEDRWYQEFADAEQAFPSDFTIYPFLEEEPLFPEQIEYPDEEQFMVTDREIRNYGDEVCELPGHAGKLLTHDCTGVNLHLLGFLNEKSENFSLPGILPEALPVLLVTLLLMAAAGIVLIVLIYRPMGKTLNGIIQQRKQSRPERELAPQGTKNEFELISSLFQEQKDHENRLNDLLQKSSKAVTEQVLRDIIDGNEKSEPAIREIFSSLAAPLDCDLSYKLILVTVQQKADSYSAVEAEISRIAIRDLSREFWREKAQVHILNYNEQRVVLVLGFSRELSVRNINEWTKEFTERCQSRFRDASGIPVSGSSPLFAGIFSLEEAFSEAKADLQKNLYYNADGKEPKDVCSVYKNKFNLCLERIGREPEEATKSMQMILQSARDYPKEERQILLDSIDCMLEYLLRCQIPCEESWLDHRNSFTDEAVFEAQKETLRGWLDSFLQEAVDKIMDQAGTVQMHYLEQAKSYIRNHYDDSNLSLLTVSESCNISRGYLSKLFARYSDGSFTDYLNDYRVQKACELLRTTGFSVQEVGLKTGFNSPQSFSRVFKKYMNGTPSQYRAQTRRQGGEYEEK